ncbi:TPM domain-containing protein [Pedobacter cryophilus]|uniref:TPM domain-containing protein n=1 Tax=Pedobacter cryophilus TaxID=2571271 RepID=A0A4U1C6V6_9SPHI|nr:TPM domain-containing protein [Pedobacter cryophilus]TKC00107.1 TPM domain-containing protein [Pedobacter cryophilus]
MSLLSDKEQEKIKHSIEWAEKATSGEVRVCIEKKCSKDAYERAIECFFDLKMQETKQRNGVLVYVALEDHKFAIIGDSGINEVIPDGFWDTTKNLMLEKFKHQEVAEGISLGIIEAGKQLKKYFPYNSDDINELPDDITFLH